MKHFTLWKSFLLLCALVVGSNVWAADTWVKTTPSDLTTGDVVVIVDQTSSKAMSNTSLNSKGAPNAVDVTLKADKSEISSEVTTGIQWALTTSGTGEDKTFKFSKDASNHLNVTSDNNGVRVGSGDRNTFTIATGGDNNGYYLYNISGTDTRYVGCYSSQDWRCYGSINNNIKANNIAFYKKTTASGPVDPVVTISATTISTGNTATISAPNELTIDFESDNESVATVDDEGVVTAIAAGTATITATWSAVADTYNAGSKEFEITVINATVYVKVTNSNQLVAGNKYIVVAPTSNMAMGAQSGSIRNNVAVTVSDNKVTIVNEEVAELTLGGVEDAWTFLASDNNKYLALTSASNALHESDDATLNTSQWTVTDDFQLKPNGYSRYLRYNSGSPRFACYEKNQVIAYLFVKQGSDVSTTVSINSACTDGNKFYGTYSNEKAFRVPIDVTVSTIAVNESGKLTVTDYNEGDIVKASTGVLISSATSGAHTLILTEEDGTENAGNMLKASSVAMTGSNKFYRLTMHNGTTLGFYWGAADGAAFDIAANKAYLAVPASLAKDGFGFGDDETTGINLNVKDNITNSPMYNLSGQRVGEGYKGLVIVNGKKFINK